MGEADAIGSPIIQDLKLKEEEEEDTGLRAGLYAPYRSRVAYGPSVNQVLTGHS